MADLNLSRDGNGGDRDDSGGNSRPPLLRRSEHGDNVCPVPLWEREFCRDAYDIPWETFCRNKWFIGLHKNVMDWDDSEALKNFLDAKERFRALYHGEPYEDPEPDPDMYIDEVDHPLQNTSNNNLYVGGSSKNLHQQGPATAIMLPNGGRLWIGGNSSGGARNCNVGGGGSGSGGGKNWKGGSSSGGGDNGSGRNRSGGGGGGGNRNSGGGGGISCNCFGRGTQRNQAEGQHVRQRDTGGMQRNQAEGQHRQGNTGGMQRNHNGGQHQMTSGGRQQQEGQRIKWRLMPSKDDPLA